MTWSMNVLSLNGGGTSGYATVRFLKYLEAEVGPLHTRFDLIAGTSVGSIIGAMVALGRPVSEIEHLFLEEIPKIFQKPWWKVWRGITTPRYDHSQLVSLIEEATGGALLSQAKTRFMCGAVKISPVVSAKFWKSWEDRGYKFSDVCGASASAPTYFKPAEIDNQVFLDGGLVCNDPSMCALAEVLRLEGVLHDPYILNIRPCSPGGFLEREAEANTLSWAKRLPSICVTANQKVSEYQCHSIIKFAHHVVDLAIDAPLDAWTPELQLACEGHAYASWADHHRSIKDRFHV